MSKISFHCPNSALFETVSQKDFRTSSVPSWSPTLRNGPTSVGSSTRSEVCRGQMETLWTQIGYDGLPGGVTPAPAPPPPLVRIFYVDYALSISLSGLNFWPCKYLLNFTSMNPMGKVGYTHIQMCISTILGTMEILDCVEQGLMDCHTIGQSTVFTSWSTWRRLVM